MFRILQDLEDLSEITRIIQCRFLPNHFNLLVWFALKITWFLKIFVVFENFCVSIKFLSFYDFRDLMKIFSISWRFSWFREDSPYITKIFLMSRKFSWYYEDFRNILKIFVIRRFSSELEDFSSDHKDFSHHTDFYQ